MKKWVQFSVIVYLLTQISYAQLDHSANNLKSYKSTIESNNLVNVNLDSLMLDSMIVSELISKSIPGFTSIIVKDNKVIWNKNYGFRNRELQLPVEDSTIFLIASTSKTIVATAVMQLWEKKIITLENNINNYLPAGFSVVNPYYPNDTITVKMLMTHTSSLQDNWNILELLTICGDSPIKLDSFLINYFTPGKKYYSQSNFYNYHPGTDWNYSNVEISLLAMMVENLTGKSFDEYCRENIFNPLSMGSASWFLQGMDLTQIAIPYNGSSPICNQGFPLYPSGFLRVNKLDLSHLLLAYLNKGVYKNHRILDSATVKFMLSDQIGHSVFDIGFEWMQGLIWYNDITLNKLSGSSLTWGHNGSSPGCLSGMAHNPDEKWGYIFFINWRPMNDLTGGSSDLQPNIIRYARLYGNIYALRPSIAKPFARTNIDSILFNTTFSNIYGHPYTPYLIYSNSDRKEIDSLKLFDDGLHGDKNVNDGIYAGYIPPQITEDFYTLSVSTIDEQTNKYFNTSDISRFTTAGPLIVDSVQYKKIGNLYYARPFVENKSRTTTIKNAKINILCNDPWVTSIAGVKLPDIPPGTTMGSSTWGVIHYIDSLFHNTFNLKFDITIDDWTYWKDSTDLIIAGISDNIIRTLTFNLEQNYPNPFNPITKIKYSIPNSSFVTLKVFDILGRELETLINEEKTAGIYEIDFDASQLSSGVYFYQIKAGEFIQTKKMILIK